MTIYEYFPDSNKFECLEFASKYDSILETFHSTVDLREKWKPIPAKLDVSVGLSGDFPSVLWDIPVCTLRAWSILESLIGKSVEVLPLKCPDRNFFALHVIAVVDCLDAAKCEFKRYSSGKIMRVAKFAFRSDPAKEHHMFRIPDAGGVVFVTEKFKKTVEAAKLKGLIFRPVPT